MIAPPFAPLTHPAPLELQQTISLTSTCVAGLHARKVNVKEAFTLADSAGNFFRAALHSLTATAGEALVYERMALAPESPVEVTLVCAVLQRQRMLWVAQKAAELGVARIQPVFTLKSVPPAEIGHEKPHAWPGQALKGARQCRRASLPEVCRTVPLDEVLASAAWREADRRLYLDDRADENVSDLLVPCRSVMLVIGPEGGFANVERQRLVDAGARSLRLGGRVLRAETAVMVGLTVVQHRIGDLTL